MNFRSVGRAYCWEIAPGQRFWLRRNSGHGFDLIWQERGRDGKLTTTRVGKHRTIADAAEAAARLAGALA